jgi:hypothetical protein
LLNLLVRIKHNLALVIVCKPKRQGSDQFAALGFTQESATHPGADQVQFRFTHRALQS